MDFFPKPGLIFSSSTRRVATSVNNVSIPISLKKFSMPRFSTFSCQGRSFSKRGTHSNKNYKRRSSRKKPLSIIRCHLKLYNTKSFKVFFITSYCNNGAIRSFICKLFKPLFYFLKAKVVCNVILGSILSHVL